MNSAYQVKLDTFEGPLDLLLHLINRMEIDIYDIPVAEITNQYMYYIHTMQQFELDVASEYLVMAATLLEMKSGMLLPNRDIEETGEEFEEDPREELLARLLEYRKFKEAAAKLQEKEMEENQLYVRPKIELEDEDVDEVQGNHSVSIFDLIDALHRLTERKNFSVPLTTKVNRTEISVEGRMEEILAQLTTEKTAFTSLFSQPDKSHIVVTFLAVLQLLKNNEIHCQQKAQFEPIFVSKLEG